jgi:NSS family neurotransmitter:Na+ symporter
VQQARLGQAMHPCPTNHVRFRLCRASQAHPPPNCTLTDFTLAGMTPFDVFDFVSSKLVLPAGGIFIALFVGWVWGFDKFSRSMTNHGQMHKQNVAQAVFFLRRQVSPALILVLMLKGLKLF